MAENRLSFNPDGQPSFVGGAPYRIAPSIVNAEALLNLKPIAAPGSTIPTLVRVLMWLNPIDWRKLQTIIDTDDVLRTKYEKLKLEYAGVASIGAESWPPPKPDEVLDEMSLVLGDIRGVVCTIDGQRLLMVETTRGPRLYTIEEYEAIRGAKIEDIIRDAAGELSTNIRRFAALSISSPRTYEVSLINREYVTVTKIVRAYTRDQLDSYAQRHGQMITDVAEPVKV